MPDIMNHGGTQGLHIVKLVTTSLGHRRDVWRLGGTPGLIKTGLMKLTVGVKHLLWT
jgi:hypothetical protein